MAKARKPRAPKAATAAEEQAVAVAAHEQQLAAQPLPEATFAPVEPPAEPAPPEQAPPAAEKPADMWEKVVSRMGPLYAGARDDLAGIRVDYEKEAKPGKPFPRVLISAPDDRKFNEQERTILKENRFAFEEGSWVRRRSAETQELALRLVNEFKKGRGDEGRGFYI